MELTVRVININPDKNSPLLKECRALGEYSRFVEEIRKHRKDRDALEKAVRECIKKRILAEYLTRKSSGVVNMLMAEYDYDMDMAVQREEAREEGELIGEKRGILLAKEEIRLHGQRKRAEEIAKILQIPEEQVHLILS